jgi:hypothetical protein
MKFLIYGPWFNEANGGDTVLYKLAKDLTDLGHSVSFFVFDRIYKQNKYCTNFTDRYAHNDEIVIYPEGIRSNPLNGKRVVRWILCELGRNCPADIWKTWSSTDLIYHYSTFNPSKNNIIYKPLFTMDLSTIFANHNKPRSGSCYTLRKASRFHRMPLNFIHPADAMFMHHNLTHTELVEIFNKNKYFYCYDPYTFLAFIAALCGCIPIVIPLEGVSKYDWLKSLCVGAYMEARELTNIAGIAYGVDDIPYAESTINDVRVQQDDVMNFGIDTVRGFIADLSNNDDDTNPCRFGLLTTI